LLSVAVALAIPSAAVSETGVSPKPKAGPVRVIPFHTVRTFGYAPVQQVGHCFMLGEQVIVDLNDDTQAFTLYLVGNLGTNSTVPETWTEPVVAFNDENGNNIITLRNISSPAFTGAFLWRSASYPLTITQGQAMLDAGTVPLPTAPTCTP
jgi:hypothetical protein